MSLTSLYSESSASTAAVTIPWTQRKVVGTNVGGPAAAVTAAARAGGTGSAAPAMPGAMAAATLFRR